MMLNLGRSVQEQERAWLTPKNWIGPAVLSAVLLAILVYGITSLSYQEGIEAPSLGRKRSGY